MGVTCLIPVELPEGKSGQQALAVEKLQKRAELMGAQKIGNWCVNCETYQAVTTFSTASKLIHLVHSTEFPYSSFAVLETGTCLVADSGFDSLMTKLKTFYTPRKTSKIEAKGHRYEYGDFVLKFGQVSAGPSFKGIIVELEYLPCLDVQQCWGLIGEFLSSFMDPSFTLPTAPKCSNKTTELFCPSDTILQYIEVFNTYRKSAGGPSLSQ